MSSGTRRVLVTVLVVLSACTNEPTSPPPTSGVFYAVSHDGRALPVFVPGYAGDTVRISFASLRFLSADRLQLRFVLLWGKRAQVDSLKLQMVPVGDSVSYDLICNDPPGALASCIPAGFVGPRFVKDRADWTLHSVGFPFPKGSVRFVP